MTMHLAAILRHRHLSRRTFLRGAGACLALPWLDAMQPALRRAPPEPLRALFVFAPNGKKMDEWRPAGRGTEFTLPYLLEPLAPVRERVLVLSGLALDPARAHGDGPGDHARSAATFLTCVHPRKTAGADLRAGVSIDQVIAASHGAELRFPSLELGLEGGRPAGNCDSGYSCAYVGHIAWRDERTPVPKETSPRAVFARLFGDPEEAEDAGARARRERQRQSLLDAVQTEAKLLGRALGAQDRAKLVSYLDAVRELERRLAVADPAGPRVDPPAGLLHGGDHAERLALMYEIVALAWQADLVRTVTLMLGNGGSNRRYGHLGIAEGHHTLSHHRGNADNLAQIRKIDRFHVEQLAGFLRRLGAIEEAGRTLLDRALVVYGSGISDGNRHNHDDLPILVAGGAGGVRGGRHLVCEQETPLANLYLAVLQRLGIERASFGDSTGALAI